MEVIKPVTVNLSLEGLDVSDYLGDSRCKSLLSRIHFYLQSKQNELNEALESSNSEHLLLLQKKTLALERKDEIVVKIGNTLSMYKMEAMESKSKINDLALEILESRMKAINYEKKFNDCEVLLKEEKNKNDKLKKEREKLESELHKIEKQMEIEVERSKKFKAEKEKLSQELNSLFEKLSLEFEDKLNVELTKVKKEGEKALAIAVGEERNRVEFHKNRCAELKKTIQSLTLKNEQLMKMLEKENKENKCLREIVEENKEIIKKWEIKSQKKNFIEESIEKDLSMIESNNKTDFVGSINNLELETKKQRLNTLFHEEKSFEMMERETQTDLFNCPKCSSSEIFSKNIGVEVQNFSRKNIPENKNEQLGIEDKISSDEKIPIVEESLIQSLKNPSVFTQTIFTPLTAEEELDFHKDFEELKKITEKRLKFLRERNQELQKLLENPRPCLEELLKIQELERKVKILTMGNQTKDKEIEQLKNLVEEVRLEMISQKNWYDQFSMDLVELNNNKSFVEGSGLKKWNEDFIHIGSSTEATVKVSQVSKDRRSITINIREFGRRESFDNHKNSRRLHSHSFEKEDSISKGHATAFSRMLRETSSDSKSIPLENQSFLKTGGFKSTHMSGQLNKKINEQISEIRKYKKYKGSLKIVKV